MKRILLLFSILIFSCGESQKVEEINKDEIKLEITEDGMAISESTVESDKQESSNDLELEVHDFESLKPYLSTRDDKVYVVNFWATWCKPCIKELPYFERVNEEYKSKNVEVLLVSLDFPTKYDSHLKPYIVQNDLKSKVVALDDADSNSWIPQVDEKWSGAIPATLIFNKDSRKFYEGSFTYEELTAAIQPFIK